MATRRTAASKAETESVQERAEVEASTDKRVVRYRGTATRRVITADDWKRLGVKDQPTTEWNFKNGFVIPVSDFAPGALDHIQKDDKLFIEE